MSQLQKNAEFLDKAKASHLNLGERLKLTRIMLRKPQKAFGEALNCAQTTISAFELNRRKPKKDFINLCAEIYNINPNYLTQGIEPMFLKEPTPLVKIEVIDKAQHTLTTKITPNAKASQSKRQGKTLNVDMQDDKTHSAYPPTLQPNKDKSTENKAHSTQLISHTKQTPQRKRLDDELNATHHNPQPNLDNALLPITPNPSYNVFSFKDIELDIVVYESKIYLSFANISKIVGYALISELMLCIRTFSQNELKKARFRTFKELNTYYKDEVYVEYKAFAACYKGHKSKDIIAFLDYAKSIESNLKQYFTQSIKLNGEYDISIFKKVELGKIRVKGDSENPLFCLADICEILEIQTPSNVKTAIEKEFDKGGGLNQYPLQTAGGVQNFTFITEPQLYFVLMRSDKPKAKPFRQWVISEVLPSIRKKGKFEYEMSDSPLITQNSQPNYNKVLDLALHQVKHHQRLIEHNQSLMLENERYKALFKREGEFTLMETAKLFEISTFELKNFLIKENLITNYAKSNKQYPTQYAKDNGFVKMKLTDTKRVSYDIYLTLALIERLKEFFGEVDL